MTTKVLLAHEGPCDPRAVIADLRRAALPSDSEALVLSVADVWVPPETGPASNAAAPGAPAPPPSDETRRRASGAIDHERVNAEEAATALRRAFPGWRVRAEASGGSPGWEIVLKADAWRPDLIVIGATGGTALNRLVFGSVARQVLTHASCSVRVARPPTRADDGRARIIVGVDTSPASDAAVQVVARRAWPSGTEARLIVVFDEMLLTALGAATSAAEESDLALRARVATAAQQESLRKAGLTVTVVARSGDAKRVIVHESLHWLADCVFVGARGLRGVKRMLMGSVSSAVAARAPCSVEVVREGSGSE